MAKLYKGRSSRVIESEPAVRASPHFTHNDGAVKMRNMWLELTEVTTLGTKLVHSLELHREEALTLYHWLGRELQEEHKNG